MTKIELLFLKWQQYLKFLGFLRPILTLFGMEGHDGPQIVFVHCPETLWSRKLKLCDF